MFLFQFFLSEKNIYLNELLISFILNFISNTEIKLKKSEKLKLVIYLFNFTHFVIQIISFV